MSKQAVSVVVDEGRPCAGLVTGAFSSRIGDLRFKKSSQSLEAESDYVSYTIEEREDNMQWLVGVFDAASHTVVMRRATMSELLMKPKVKLTQEPEAERPRGYLEDQLEFAQKFGSRKKQKLLRERLANKVELNATAAAELQSTIDELKKDTRQINTGRRVVAPNTPLHNPEAKSAADLYDWETIFGLSDEALVNQVDALNKFKDRHIFGELPPFLADNLDTKPAEVLLLRHMIVFLHENDKGELRVTDFSREKHIPEGIVVRFLDRYTQHSGDLARTVKYTRTKQLENKLFMHTTLLALKVNEFCIETTLLASALSVHPGRLQPFFKELGCTVSKTSVTLQPLSMRKPKRKKSLR